MVYADNAATTKMSRTAIDAMLPYMETHYGNPSSLYRLGQEAAEALQSARETVAACLGCTPREITFTSGGSEADNQALISAARIGERKGKKHIISTAFEHHAILHTLKKLEKEGFEVELLPVGPTGTITAQQVAELFILIGLGALGAKTGLLRPEGKQTLSNLLVNLVVPAMIINSYRMEFSAEILHNLMVAFALSTLSILLGLIITLLFTARSRDSRTPIFRFACVFSNAGYMGLPLISALFGSEGLLYASAFFTMFNLLLWTVGYSMVSGSSDPKKVAQSLLHCPAIYAIIVGLAIYLLQIPLPDLIVQPMELLGNMNTPLSMLITGMLIASGDLHRTLTDQHIWKLTVVRMLFIPVLTIAAFAALGLFRYGMVTQVIVLLECCPAASITSVFAVQFHHDEQFAAGSVVLTTLLSIVFLPLCALIITMF